VLNELTTVREKVSNIEIVTTLLGSMPKSYTSLIIAQMGQVGTFHETLSFLLEEETKRKAKLYKGDNENSTLYGGSRRVEPSLDRPKRPNIFQLRNPNWKINNNNSNNGLKKPFGKKIIASFKGTKLKIVEKIL
jgi:hypothetical protein